MRMNDREWMSVPCTFRLLLHFLNSDCNHTYIIQCAYTSGRGANESLLQWVVRSGWLSFQWLDEMAWGMNMYERDMNTSLHCIVNHYNSNRYSWDRKRWHRWFDSLTLALQIMMGFTVHGFTFPRHNFVGRFAEKWNGQLTDVLGSFSIVRPKADPASCPTIEYTILAVEEAQRRGNIARRPDRKEQICAKIKEECL